MKHKKGLLISGLLLASSTALLLSVDQKPVSASDTISSKKVNSLSTQFDLATWRQATLNELNRLRAQNGLSPVVGDDYLNSYAQNRAQTLANLGTLDDHAGFDSNPPKNYTYIDEDILGGNFTGNSTTDAQDTIKQFYIDDGVSNFGHRKSLLNPYQKKVGIGIVYKPTSSGMDYWVSFDGTMDPVSYSDYNGVMAYMNYFNADGIDSSKYPTKYDLVDNSSSNSGNSDNSSSSSNSSSSNGSSDNPTTTISFNLNFADLYKAYDKANQAIQSGKYTQDSVNALQSAVSAAHNAQISNQQQISDLTNKINSAINSLVAISNSGTSGNSNNNSSNNSGSSDNPTTSISLNLNFSNLYKAYDQANQAIQSGKYTQDSISALQSAVSAAHNAQISSQQQISDLTDKITSAINSLVAINNSGTSGNNSNTGGSSSSGSSDSNNSSSNSGSSDSNNGSSNSGNTNSNNNSSNNTSSSNDSNPVQENPLSISQAYITYVPGYGVNEYNISKC